MSSDKEITVAYNDLFTSGSLGYALADFLTSIRNDESFDYCEDFGQLLSFGQLLTDGILKSLENQSKISGITRRIVYKDDIFTIYDENGNEIDSYELGSDNVDYNKMLNKVSYLFKQGTTTISPIVLDLDGDGIETTAVADGVYFDHNADGFAEKTGWVSADDGLLVFDKNNNGTIDSGRELFGTNTEYISGILADSGYEALETVDSNHDGVINSSDAQFANLKVWKDLNQNGVSDAGELQTLTQPGVTSITLNHTNTSVTDANGNIQTEIGSYTKTNGTTATVADYEFVVNTSDTTNSTTVTISEEIAALPNIAGSSLKMCA